MTSGIVIVSHVKEIGEGVDRLIKEVAKDVPITVAAGLDQGEVGTSFERIMATFEENPLSFLRFGQCQNEFGDGHRYDRKRSIVV